MSRYSGRMLAVFGTGVLFGSGLSYLFCIRVINKLNNKITKLNTNVDDLSRDMKLLKDRLQIQHYSEVGYSITSDDDDRFVEAYDGNGFLSDTNVTQQTSIPIGSLMREQHELFRRVDKDLEGTDRDKETAYNSLLSHKSKFASSSEFLWRLSKACYTMSGIEAGRKNEEGKKKLIYASKNYALSALDYDPSSANVHKWCAISIGVVGEYEGMQQKIENGYKIKEHIDKSISLNSSDYSTYYMLGRWCYEVYMLTWIERKIAAAIFATPPTATLEQALDAFFQAEKLNPKAYKANMMYIAKCYFEQSNYTEALKWLGYADACDIKTTEDREVQQEVVTLTNKYNAYI